jgi:glycosyltransferase involved in cell wall biosynthesis
MRVLLVAYHFPPDPQVGALRSGTVAAALRDWGHEVHVVTARLPGETDPDRAGMDGVSVRTVVPLPTARDLYARAKRWLRPAARAGTGAAASPQRTGEAPTAHVATWKRYIFSLMWLPDDRQGFILPAARAARAVEGPVDLVYTSAPPYSTHLVGLLLKRNLGARWAVEFRDPWSKSPWKPAHVRTRASDALDRWLERRCLLAADHIVSVTDGIQRDFAAVLGEAFVPGRAVVVRNGIPALAAPRTDGASHQPFRIVYLGTLYHRRDPRPFLTALGAVAKRLGLGADRLRVDLVGDCRAYRGASLEELARTLELEGVVHFQDWVAHDEAERLMRSADLLLLLAQDQPTQVPQKLYEYLGTRVPILAFADAEGETADLLRRAGGHFVVTGNDIGATEAALTDAIRRHGGAAGEQPNEALLEQWTTRAQFLRLKAALGA